MSLKLRTGALVLSCVAVGSVEGRADRFPEAQVPRPLRDWTPWVKDGADFSIQEMSDTPVKTLSLDLEPGAGLTGRRLQLQIRDSHGRVMARRRDGGAVGTQDAAEAAPLGGRRSRPHV